MGRGRECWVPDPRRLLGLINHFEDKKGNVFPEKLFIMKPNSTTHTEQAKSCTQLTGHLASAGRSKRSWNIKNREWYETVVPTQLPTSARTDTVFKKAGAVLCEIYLALRGSPSVRDLAPQEESPVSAGIPPPQRHRNAFAPWQDICGKQRLRTCAILKHDVEKSFS